MLTAVIFVYIPISCALIGNKFDQFLNGIYFSRGREADFFFLCGAVYSLYFVLVVTSNDESRSCEDGNTCEL